jgi:hypothetical protein
MNLHEGGRVEVELYLALDVSVPGKGHGYQLKIEVSPNETMDVIRRKVPFYKIFA